MTILRPAEVVGGPLLPLRVSENPLDITRAQLWLGLEGEGGP